MKLKSKFRRKILKGGTPQVLAIYRSCLLFTAGVLAFKDIIVFSVDSYITFIILCKTQSMCLE